jgi:serine/threonine protein kinase
MGAVYRSTHPKTGKPVAIKVILRSLQDDAQIQERFRREILAMTRVSHPNLVRVLEAGEEDDQAYYVMDLISGQDLAHHLQYVGALSLEQMGLVARGLFSALAALHDAGILHRDLKPQNVMLTPEGEPLVMDFGLSKVLDLETMTRTGALLGSPRYLPPEVLEGKSLTAASDLYQAGLILWECAARQAVFSGQDFSETSARILSGDLLPVRSRRPDLPQEIVDVIEGCTRTRQEERIKSGHQALAVLGGRKTLEDLTSTTSGIAQDGSSPLGTKGLAEKSAGQTQALASASNASRHKAILQIVAFLAFIWLGFYFSGSSQGRKPQDLQITLGFSGLDVSWTGTDDLPAQLVVQGEGGKTWSSPQSGLAPVEPDSRKRCHLAVHDLPPGETMSVLLRTQGGETSKVKVEIPDGIFREGTPSLGKIEGGGFELQLAFEVPLSLEVGFPVKSGGHRWLKRPSALSQRILLEDVDLNKKEGELLLKVRDLIGEEVSKKLPLRDLLRSPKKDRKAISDPGS